ncbi:MAG: SCO family protein [Calditrichaeota bacterium]|nr:MAG: SCO family protein [Calditrichota bacterium]
MPFMDFTLTDQHNQRFQLRDHLGKVVVLFFGYTTCPDVCPLTLSTWKRLKDALGKDAQQVEFVYVTVDPERDTQERLAKHLAIFSPDFIGLTGTPEELQEVYSSYGVYREKVKVSDSAAGYLMNHTSKMLVLDKQGKWRLNISYNAPVADIVHDLRILLKE